MKQHLKLSSGRLAVGSSLLILVITLVMAGEIFFWGSNSSSGFVGDTRQQSELEVARSGLQTMKRMVGDQQAWSESIREEYDRLFVSQVAVLPPIVYSYSDNFVGSSSPAGN